jgi:predicted metalloendopeptidase
MHRTTRRRLTSAAAVLALSGCGGAAPQPTPTPVVTVNTPAPAARSGIDKAQFDAAVRPQDDLYRAINGRWLKETEIPADRSNYGAFTVLADEAEKQIRAIVERTAAASDAADGSEAKKVGDFFATWMDEAAVEKQGVTPLRPLLTAITAMKSKAELPAMWAKLARLGVAMPLYPYVNQDDKDANTMIGGFNQAGLGLPDRDFYLQQDEKFAKIRAAYLAHIEKMLTLLGDKDAKAAAAAIVALETELAKAQWDRVKNRDPVATYNKFDREGFAKLAANIDLPAYNKAVGFGELPAVLVRQPSYVTELGKLVGKTPLQTWQRYLRWHVLTTYAEVLPKAFDDENFAFYGKTLQGVPEQRPRWKRALSALDHTLGFAVGKLYVAEHFPPAHKEKMDALVQNLVRAYDQELGKLEWMSPETRAAAKAKLAKFRVKIGYPKVWRDYAALEVVRGELFGNRIRSASFHYERALAKLGKPVDRTEWYMTPQTVNAYYDPQNNEIVFPAAILQPPFFDADADPAVNYGGIGAVIGHEISHGFDDQGSQYDGDGNLRSWWTKEDRERFDARTAALAAEYATYEPVPGYKLDGKFTLGENIADLGGLKMGFVAWQLSLGGKPSPVIDGLTGAQRVFAGWAQVWRRNYRQENLLNRIKTDPHSPSEFRANGTPRNLDAFHEAFGTKAGDKMWKDPTARIRIW